MQMRVLRAFFLVKVFALVFFTSTNLFGQTDTWTPIGPPNAVVLTMQQDPFQANRVYAGIYFGGLFVSYDSGKSWNSINSPFTTDAVFVLACDPVHAGVLYAGTFEHGLFQTTDFGATWTGINNGISSLDDEALALDPFSPNTLIVSSGGNGYRSTDAGATWTPVPVAVRSILFDATHSGTVYVGTYSNGLMKSTDHGQTFSAFSTGIGTNTTLSLHQSSDGTTLYAAALQGIFELDANQTQWLNITGSLPWNGSGDIVSLPGDGKTLIAATDQGIYTEDKSAASPAWTQLATFGTRTIFAPGNGTIWALSTYSGLFSTPNILTPFALSQNGIQNYFVEALASVNNGGSGTLLAGTNTGVFSLPSGTSAWGTSADLQAQTIFALRPHPTQSSTVFAGTQSGGVYQTTDLAAHWTPLSQGLVPRQVTSIVQFTDVKQVVLAGATSGVYQSLDNGKTWTQTVLLAGVLSLATDPAVQGSAYVGLLGGQILRSTDFGTTFYQISTSGLPASDVIGLTAIPFGRVYAILANGQVYAAYSNSDTWLQMNAASPIPGYALAETRAISLRRTWEPVVVVFIKPLTLGRRGRKPTPDSLISTSIPWLWIRRTRITFMPPPTGESTNRLTKAVTGPWREPVCRQQSCSA